MSINNVGQFNASFLLLSIVVCLRRKQQSVGSRASNREEAEHEQNSCSKYFPICNMYYYVLVIISLVYDGHDFYSFLIILKQT